MGGAKEPEAEGSVPKGTQGISRAAPIHMGKSSGNHKVIIRNIIGFVSAILGWILW